jgi:hypothetical protein
MRTQRLVSEESVASGGSPGTASHAIATQLANNATPRHDHGSPTNFDRIITSDTLYEGITVTVYKSRETGLQVMFGHVEVPLVRVLRD